jgi:phage terminase large subunit
MKNLIGLPLFASALQPRRAAALLAAHHARRPPDIIVPIPYEPANPKFAAFHAAPQRVRAIFGGNRSGKSEAGGEDVCQFALTHPNAVIWVCSVTYDAIGEYTAPKIFKYLPKNAYSDNDIAWVNKRKRIPSLLILYNNTHIYFKSYDQGREKFQGAEVDIVWHDEEPPRDIYQECLMRLLDRNGRYILTMTPLKGLSWAYDAIDQVTDDHPAIWRTHVSLYDNKYIEKSVIDEVSSLYTQDELLQRIEGRFMRPEGSVWKELNMSLSFIPRFAIPPEWKRIRAIDFGYSNPFCCLWLAMNDDQEIFVYQEHYQKEMLLKDHARIIHEMTEADFITAPIGNHDARVIREMTGEMFIEATVGDHDAQGRAELAQYGISIKPAQKDVEIGLQAVNRMWKVKPNGRPSLFVFNDLKHTRRECLSYHYKTGTETPDKFDDHTQDAMRYAVMYWGTRLRRVTLPMLTETARAMLPPLNQRGLSL